MTQTADLLIVGGGPAGIAAAVEATSLGLSVVLLDENAAPGGRIWQALERRGAQDADDAAGLALIRRFRASPVVAHWQAQVWAIEPDETVYWSQRGAAQVTTARFVLVATGTVERPLPVPGWTLPGVMTVGAAQIALKTGGLVPSGRTWLAGQGPLLWLYAVQALRAGGQLAGILDLSDGFAPFRALGRVTPAGLPEISKGLAWRRALSQSGVPWFSAADLRADGDDKLRSVSFRHRGAWQHQAADLLLLHDGVIPSVQMTRAAGCEHTWNAAQRCWQPDTDAWGQTSVPHLLVAGDGGGVEGAAAATFSGRLAALEVARRLGRLTVAARDAAAAPLRIQRARALAARPALDALFAPRPMRLEDETIVCRCEEVTAAEVRRAVRDGCRGMNQLKAYTRCGMGRCQGRLCAPVAIEVLAAARNVPVEQIEPLRTRFPTKPVSLAELAALGPATGAPLGSSGNGQEDAAKQERNTAMSTTTQPASHLFLPVRDDWLARRTEAILEPDLPIVDPHHHLWERPAWRYMLDDLLADTNSGHNIVATVFLQCRSMHRASGPEEFRPVGETEFVNGVAAMSASGGYGPTKICAGIVGHVDLRLGERARDVLQAHIRAGGDRFRGIRHITAWDPDPSLMNPAYAPPPRLMYDETFRAGFACLAPLNLSFDAWLYHPQIGDLTALAQAFPGTMICLNHIGGPLAVGAYAGRRQEITAEWAKSIKQLATCPNVVVKLGGMAMGINGWDFHTKAEPPSSQELATAWKPYVDTCIEAFGASRCMFESNFPVDKGSYSYQAFWNACKILAKDASAAEKTDLFSGTAARFYRLEL